MYANCLVSSLKTRPRKKLFFHRTMCSVYYLVGRGEEWAEFPTLHVANALRKIMPKYINACVNIQHVSSPVT